MSLTVTHRPALFTVRGESDGYVVPFSLTDAGDGTYTALGVLITDNGDGTFHTTGSAVDQGDGTVLLAA